MQQALLSAAQRSLDSRLLLALSDPPPGLSHSGEVPRVSVSQDRLRTLEFAMEDPPATPAKVAAAAPLASSKADDADLDLRPRFGRGLRVALIGALTLGLAAGAALLLTRGPQVRVSGPTAAARAALGATVATSPNRPGSEAVSEQPASITVSLLNVPKTALVFVDDEPAGGDTLELPRDGRNRVIKVTAPGKIPWQAVHHASADASFDVALVDRESTTAAPRASRTVDTSRGPSAGQKKAAHKKPPSALRRLDF